MEKINRKNNRLKDYDYSSCGAYFITICIENRKRILWEPVGANCVRPCKYPELSALGKIIDDEIQRINNIYKGVSVEKYCIMPNHLHMIIMISADQSGRTQFAPTTSRIIKQFKGSITKKIGYSIWQKSYYDHVIRTYEDYCDVWNYIDVNPLNWQLDELN